MKREDLKKITYQSWQNGNEWTDDEIEFIIKKDCTCDECGESVEEFNDFPELLIQEDELLCDECYGQKYRVICPICEDSYDIKDGESEYWVRTEEDAKKDNAAAGIYGPENLFVPININYLKKIDCGENCFEVYSDDICPDCVSNLVRKDNFMKSHGTGTPCILIKKYENHSVFKDWTPERFKRERQRLIHQRVTVRGIIELANNKTKKISV